MNILRGILYSLLLNLGFTLHRNLLITNLTCINQMSCQLIACKSSSHRLVVVTHLGADHCLRQDQATMSYKYRQRNAVLSIRATRIKANAIWANEAKDHATKEQVTRNIKVPKQHICILNMHQGNQQVLWKTSYEYKFYVS